MNPLVEAARRYKNVPFRHRGRTGRALDCAGLVWLAYRDCGLSLPDFRLYGREPHQDGLIGHIQNALGAPVTGLEVGDVIVVRFDVEPHHMAIVTPYPYGGLAMIHACGTNKRVIEHRMAPDHVKRITHVFRRRV